MILKVGPTYDKIKELKGNVFYTRFGDGEIIFMSGKTLGGDPLIEGKHYFYTKEVFTKSLQKELIEAYRIKEDNFLQGLALDYPLEKGMSKDAFAPSVQVKRLKTMIRTVELDNGIIPKTFYSPVCYHYIFAFKPKLWKEFVAGLGTTLFVGGANWMDVEKIIPVRSYIHTPMFGASGYVDEICSRTMNYLNEETIYDTIILCCGFSSTIIAKRLYNGGWQGDILDIGSLFDIFIQPYTRGWLAKLGDQIKTQYDY